MHQYAIQKFIVYNINVPYPYFYCFFMNMKHRLAVSVYHILGIIILKQSGHTSSVSIPIYTDIHIGLLQIK